MEQQYCVCERSVTVLCLQNNDSVQNEGSSSLHIIGYEQCAFDVNLWTIQIMLSLIY